MPVRLMMTSCQSVTDVVAIHGIDKSKFEKYRAVRVDADQMAAFEEDTSGALVGAKIAARYEWKIGQSVTLEELDGISFTVTGILKERGSADDFLIYTGRRFLQEADGAQGTSHYVLVKPKPGVEMSSLCRSIDALPLTVSTHSQPEEALLMTVLDQLRDLVKLSKGIIVIIIIVVLIAVGNAISMATRDRSQEFGILRTLGYPRRAVAAVVMGEGIVQGMIGAVIGCTVVQALIWANLIQSVSTCSVTVEFAAGPRDWAIASVVVIASAALGSLAPAWSASRMDIVEALHPEE
jgi:putative ABC transport system permease protein